MDKEKAAEKIIAQEVEAVCKNSALVRGNGCAACHVLSTVAEKMGVSEADAADLLSEVLLDRPELNERFVEMVEQVHMKERVAGVGFAVKRRNEKDLYLESQFKNALEELLGDAAKHGTEIAMRRLVVAQVALQIAQNLGIDYHAATEELYYYMRKNDRQTHEEIMQIIKSMLGRGRK